jgi:Raf kinase inhibitor-like YbhB/YbcL family protein
MFILESEGFVSGYILDKYGINAEAEAVVDGVPQLSFPVHWSNPPAGTISYAIVFLDYDNIPDEGFCWIHWLVGDIPVLRFALAENESRENETLIQGRNSWMTPLGPYGMSPALTDFYGGPAPSYSHEYEVKIYALDTMLGLRNGFFYNELRRKMDGHILGAATLKGIYTI